MHFLFPIQEHDKLDFHLQGGMGRAAKKGEEGSVIIQISSVRSFVTSR